MMRSSVSFTLPLSCQICLGKVKEPVTCSNQHVFCSSCMNLWLDKNSRCPTCRVEITPQSPVRRIIGGMVESNESTSRTTSRELRRARYELILKEYEDEIIQLENSVDTLSQENTTLRDRIKSVDLQSFPSTSKEYFKTEPHFCRRCEHVKDLEYSANLSERLQEMTKTSKKMKRDLGGLKQTNEILMKENDDLKMENQKIKMEFLTRSPAKFGRLTVATLESRLEAAEKQKSQLERAMEKNDKYTEQLENEVKDLKTVHNIHKATTIENHLISMMNETPSTKLKTLSLNTPKPRQPEHTLDISMQSFNELCDSQLTNNSQNNDSLEGFFEVQQSDDFQKSSFSRKLHFDEPSPSNINLNKSEGYNIGMELPSELMEDSPFRSVENNMCSNYHTMLNAVNFPQSPSSQESLKPTPSPTPAMKTTIDAGGSRITMSHLSPADQDVFSRPNSAPSRTFLLSGSRFSALRPLDPEADSNNPEFQPVKCISPMHMFNNPQRQDDRSRSPVLKLVSPDLLINTKWKSKVAEEVAIKQETSRFEDEPKQNNFLSRVNILKRNTSFSKNSYPSTSSPPISENRRKQKFSHKRSGEALIQNALKSPKM